MDAKAAARAVFNVWNSGELDQLDSLVAADVLHHDPQDPNAAEGRDGMKRTIERTREQFPDLHITVEQQLAEGDLVATRWSGRMSAPGSDQAITVSGITIDRLERGLIVEAWRNYQAGPADEP
jgi:steroid delta-isomerase-like uncharacterized protein